MLLSLAAWWNEDSSLMCLWLLTRRLTTDEASHLGVCFSLVGYTMGGLSGTINWKMGDFKQKTALENVDSL